MFIINTIFYTMMTIAFVPALIILAYILLTNSKYNGIINVFGISSSTVWWLLAVMFAIYCFFAGSSYENLPTIWSSTVFIACFVGSLFLAGTICGVMRIANAERIKYANTVLADEKICEKIRLCDKQIQELTGTMAHTGLSTEMAKLNQQRINEVKEMAAKLVKIHQELQEQKIILNAGLSTRETRNVVLKDKRTVNKMLDKEAGKFNMHRDLTSGYGSAADVIRKYQ